MGVGDINSLDLDKYVEECDKLGGIHSPEAISFADDFTLALNTQVDQNLDPFSEAYFDQQLAVYEEISGRSLIQKEGEQTPVEIAAHLNIANPYGSHDIHFISKHCRAVLTALLVSNLPPNSCILDLGCGWGLSSEMMGYCGATVDAIDINPLFVELVNIRSGPRHLKINAQLGEFDDFQSDRKYDMAFFYESLHHSMKPWKTLSHISRCIKPSGKITFAGEPVDNTYWKNWGIRLDYLSVYCIRKFGWVENAWSKYFITQCFEYAGFELELCPLIGLDNGFIGVATRKGADKNLPFGKPRFDFASSESIFFRKYQALAHSRWMRVLRFIKKMLRK
jgi:2-polyprenyl-3-methyl-5-hydroxy-6-metoxy-1,4-benzoquinol methylase